MNDIIPTGQIAVWSILLSQKNKQKFEDESVDLNRGGRY